MGLMVAMALHDFTLHLHRPHGEQTWNIERQLSKQAQEAKLVRPETLY